MRFAAAALLTLVAGCIERPFDEARSAGKAQFDRAALRDALQPPPPDATPVGAVFGNAAELLAYKLEPAALKPGERARLTLYWRCRAEMGAVPRPGGPLSRCRSPAQPGRAPTR